MISKKSLKSNVILNMMLTLSGIIFPLITFPYVTRVLQPEGTGQIAFANSIVNYFSMFAALGIPTYGIRTCAKVRDDRDVLSRTVCEIMAVNFIMTAISYLVLGVAVILIEKLHDVSCLIAIFSLNMILSFIGVEWLYKALENYSYITARSLIIKTISVVLMFVFVKTKEDVVIYAGILVLANTGYGIFNFLNLKKYISFTKIKSIDIFKHIKPISIFFAMTVATTIYTNLDATMLGFMCTDTDVGIYDVAVKIKVILVSIITSLGMVLLPRASYYIENKKITEFRRVSGKAMEFVLAVSIPCTLAFTITADKCIVFLSGSAYKAATVPMRIIMPTLILIGITNIIGLQMLVPLGKEIIVLFSEIIGAVIDLILNIILIPLYGAAGAALGTLAAETAVFLVQLLASRKEIIEMSRQLHPIKISVSALIAAFFMFIAKKHIEYGVFYELIILMGIYVTSYSVCMVVLKETIVIDILQNVKNRVIKIDKN